MPFPHDQTAELWIQHAVTKWDPEELAIIVALAEVLADQNGRKKLYVHELQQAEQHFMKEGHAPRAK